MSRARTVWIVAALLSGFGLPNAAWAGFIALPLKAELDLAETVVVGKIVELTKERTENRGMLVWGRATIAVERVLKGKPAEQVTATVAMHLAREWGGQSPPRVYREGDEGIWVIMPSGRPSHGYGLLEKKRLPDVREILAELDKRIWSKPVNGICVWAGAEPKAPTWRSLHGQGVLLMFAAKNVSKEIIYLPLSQYHEVVSGVLRHSTGREYPLTGIGMGIARDDRALSCEPLSAGGTRYMHPDEANYGFFRLPGDLPAGEYTVTITLKNSQTEGRQRRTPEKRVKPWQGTVTSPPITLSQPGPAASTQPKGAAVEYAVSPADFLRGALMQARMVLLIIGIGTACGIGGILYKVVRPDGNKWPVMALGLMGILAALLFGYLWWAVAGDYLLSHAMPYRVIVLFTLLPLLSGALALRLSLMRLTKRSACP